jgi:hypothetical protein
MRERALRGAVGREWARITCCEGGRAVGRLGGVAGCGDQ